MEYKLIIDPELDVNIQKMLTDWTNDDELNEFANISIEQEGNCTYSGGVYEVILKIFEYAAAGAVGAVIKDAATGIVVDKTKVLIDIASARVKKCFKKQEKEVEIESQQHGRYTILIIKKKDGTSI